MTTLTLPIYSIYQRDISIEHLRAGAIIVNPIAKADSIIDGREAYDKTVAACEGNKCELPTQRNGMTKACGEVHKP